MQSQWSNKILASLLVVAANSIMVLAHLLPRKARESVEAVARLLKNIAFLIVQPDSIRRMGQPHLYLKVIRDIAILVCPLSFAGVFAVLEAASLTPGPVVITFSPWLIITIILCAVAFSILFTMLVNLLVLSGDFSFKKQDELQRALSNQAAAFTLYVIIVLLILLFLCYLLLPQWRNLAAVHLSILFFLARITYLLKLFQLRWKEMGEVELGNDGRSQTVEMS